MTRHNLIELFSKVEKSGDEVLDFVRLDFAIRGLNTNLVKEVTIQPLPLSLTDHLQERVAFKACYANTFEALKKLKGNGCKYVLGYWHHIIPVEHCFLRIGDRYHDPTGEILFSDGEDRRYFAAFEMNYVEVRQHLRDRGEFPGIYEYQRQAESKLAA